MGRGRKMNKEEQFFPDKSELEQSLINFIKLCQEVDRNVPDELTEALTNASNECGLKLDIDIFDD